MHRRRPPPWPTRPVTTEHHGRTRIDDYEWLREKGPRGDGVPRGGERLHRGSAPPTLPTCGRRSSTRSRPAPWRPTSRCRPATAASGTTAAPSRARSTAPPAASRSGPDDWTPPTPDEDCAPDQPALPGEQVLLDLDALAEGHEFFSLGGSSVSPHATLLAYSIDVVGDERYTIRVKDLGTGEQLARRDHRRHGRGDLGPRTARTSTTRPSTSPGAPTRSGGTGSAPSRRRRAGPPRDRRPVLRRRRPEPERPVPGDRVGLQGHLGVPLPRRRRPRAGLAGLRGAQRGAGVLPRPRRARPARTASWCCTTAPGRTSRSAPPRSRPRRRRSGSR